MSFELATFVDRHTLRYDRRYPHPIDLVFEAVSTAEHLDIWMLPISRVERRAGGHCSFTWGFMSEENADQGTVTEFDPPHRITYGFDRDASFIRFDLEPDGDGTLLHFTLHWPVPPGEHLEAEPYPGGDLPAGTDTNWRPGAVGGFHEFLDDLGEYLAGRFTADDRAAHLEDVESERHVRLTETYRDFIRDQCPR